MQARELSFGLLARVDTDGTIRRDLSDQQQLVHFALGNSRGDLLTLDGGGVHYEQRKMFRETSGGFTSAGTKKERLIIAPASGVPLGRYVELEGK